MKKSRYKMMMLFLTISTLLMGCASSRQQDDGMEVVYLKNDYGDLFVDIKNDNPFTGTIPEEILDETGEKLSKEEMKNGDVYLVYGDEIMLESYPGQYPGITKLVRLEKENSKYLDKYGDFLNQFISIPDTSTPPELSVGYRQPNAQVSASVSRGGYQWTTTGEDGQAKSEVADSFHILDWDDELLQEQKIEGETQFTLLFTYEPRSVEVKSWPADSRNTDGTGEYPEGENVAVEQVESEDGGSRFAFQAKAGHVYQIQGSWEEGTAEYGFFTSEIPS